MRGSPSAKEVSRKETGDGKERYDGPIICPGHSRPIPDLHYSQVTPDGYFLASACLDGKPMIREGSNGDWIGTLTGHKGAVWMMRLNSVATRAVTASADFSAKLWDAIGGTELHSFPHKHIVRACEFSLDSLSVYTGGTEKKLRIYDLEKPEAEPLVCSGHTGTISHIALSKDPNLILSGAAEEKYIAVWDRRTQAIENKLETPAQLSSFQVSIEGSIITAASGQFVSFWDSKRLTLIKTHKMSTKIDCAAYHPNAKFFVTGTSVELWARAHDFNTSEEIAVNKGHHGPVRCLAFNPAGDAYASGSEDGTIRIWEWGKDKAKEKRKENGSEEEVGLSKSETGTSSRGETTVET
jgi:serine-threonine kinase receptor-associated protein